MKKNMTYEEKHIWMTETPVEKIIPRLAVPTIISMLVTSIYNMADTYFVSQINTEASAAVGIIFSLMAMIQAIGFTLGMGSGNVISRSLGAKNRERAQQAASVSFVLAIALGVLLAMAGLRDIRAFVGMLGAKEETAVYAADYGRYILIAAPYMAASFVLNNHLRSQGNALFSMIGIATGGILNMILDPVFIFVLDLGISGAAIATILSQFISFCILLTVTLLQKNMVRFNLRHFTLRPRIYADIIYAGMPTLARQGLASVSSVLLNQTAAGFGAAVVAAFSIVNRIMMFIYSGVIGFGQGFQPVCGYNYGAGKYKRVLEAYRFCRKVALCILLCLAIIFFAAAIPVLTLFRDDAEVITIGARALRLQCLMLPFQAWIVMSNMLAQSIGFGFRATVTAIGRQGLFFIPIVLVLPGLCGIIGLQLVQPSADLCTFILSVVVTRTVVRELEEKDERKNIVV